MSAGKVFGNFMYIVFWCLLIAYIWYAVSYHP